MKTLNIILPLLLCGCFEAILVGGLQNLTKIDVTKWLDMKLEDVNEQCKKNVNYLIDHSTYLEYRLRLQEFFGPAKEEDLDASRRIFNSMYNSDLIKKMKDLIELIQNCLDDKNRLDAKDLPNVFVQILQMHAMRVIKFDPPTFEEFQKCGDLLDKEEINECFRKGGIFKPGSEDQLTTIYDLLSLNYAGRSTCEDILPSAQCLMDATRVCSKKAESVLLFLLSPSHVGVCPNFVRKADTNHIHQLNNIIETLL